jgi:thiamine pyrophosphokinase
MDSLEVKLPQGILQLTSCHKKKILLVAGGRKPEGSWLQFAKSDNDIYAVDRGLDYCLEINLFPKVVYGDKDSSDPINWLKAEKAGTECKSFLPAKDDTDLQLLLGDLPSESILIATGVWGGRADHLYANIFSLLAYKEKKKSQVILADQQEIMVLLGVGEEVTFMQSKKTLAVSLLPLSDVNKVSIIGVKWPLIKSTLHKNKPYAISNEIVESKVKVVCHSGCIGFYLNFEGGE